MKKILFLLFIACQMAAMAQSANFDSLYFYVKPNALITSKGARYGQEFQFTVTEDVVVDGAVIIEAGAQAYGVVSYINKAGLFGEPGEIEIQMDVVEGVGKDYPISGPLLFSKGRSRKTLTILLGVLVNPLFLLIHGQQANIYPNTEIELKLGQAKRRTRSN